MRRRLNPSLPHLRKPDRYSIPSTAMLFPTIPTKKVPRRSRHVAVLGLYHATLLGRCEQLMIQEPTKPIRKRHAAVFGLGHAAMLDRRHLALFGRCEQQLREKDQ